MSTLLNKPMYVIKLSTKGEGGVKKVPKSVYVVYGSSRSKRNIDGKKNKKVSVKRKGNQIKELMNKYHTF